MKPHRESGNLLFARINWAWLGYVIFSAISLFLLLSALDPLVNQAFGSGFRSPSPPPAPMTLHRWIGAGLAVCFYCAGAVYAGCVERNGKLFMNRAAILAALNVATAARGICLFLLPLVAMIATAAGLVAAGVHGRALPIVPIGAMLGNWLCFRIVAWWRPRS